MKANKPLFLDMDDFFKNFDDSTIKDKVNGLAISVVEDDNGRIALAFGIDGKNLTNEEEQRIAEHFEENCDIPYLTEKLLKYYDDLEREKSAPIGEYVNANKNRSGDNCEHSGVVCGKPLYLNKNDFFQGFNDEELKKKVCGVKIFIELEDFEKTSVVFATDSTQSLSSNEYKKLEEHFQQKYTSDEAKQKLAQYYSKLRERGIDPIEHPDVPGNNRPKKDRDNPR